MGCFYKQSREEFSIFWGVFNKTIIPLSHVGYEMITANLLVISIISYPTQTRGIIVKYRISPSDDGLYRQTGHHYQIFKS